MTRKFNKVLALLAALAMLLTAFALAEGADVEGRTVAPAEGGEVLAQEVEPQGEAAEGGALEQDAPGVEEIEGDGAAAPQDVAASVKYCFIVGDVLFAEQAAAEGEEILRPEDPEAPEGMIFAGWVLDDGFETPLFVDADEDGVIDPVIAHVDALVTEVNVYARFAEAAGEAEEVASQGEANEIGETGGEATSSVTADAVPPSPEGEGNGDDEGDAEAPAEAPVETTTEAPAVGSTEASAEQPSEIIAEQPAGTAAEQPTETAAEQPVETAAETVAEQPTETAAETAAEQPVETTAEQTVETAAEQTVETAAEQPTETAAETAAEQPTETAVEQPTETAAETVAEQLTETAAETAAEQPVETAAEQLNETAAEQTVETAAETVAKQPVETAAEQAAETAARTTVEAIAEQPTDAPVPASLTYTGEAQALVVAAEGWLFSLAGETYSADIPTAINAGEYTVYFRPADDVDAEAQALVVTVAKADATFIPPVAATGEA